MLALSVKRSLSAGVGPSPRDESSKDYDSDPHVSDDPDHHGSRSFRRKTSHKAMFFLNIRGQRYAFRSKMQRDKQAEII